MIGSAASCLAQYAFSMTQSNLLPFLKNAVSLRVRAPSSLLLPPPACITCVTRTDLPAHIPYPRHEYHWADGVNIKKPIKCSAPEYVDYLMTWVQTQLDDESIFPSKIGMAVHSHVWSRAASLL